MTSMTTQMSWREERRRDRLAEAQISRENEAARVRARIAEAEAQARLRRDEIQARHADRRAARKQRAARQAERMGWLREHVTGLLFVPVIVVPGVLAWTAMAAYGVQVFGPAGVTLPAFSEGAMWAFAAATTITRRRSARDGIERPVWHLRLGTAVFAAEGAVLNFIHGTTPAAGALRGIGTGVVMALVSVAGVVAHQLITAGPRRSRAERGAARHERAAARREQVIRRAALRRAHAHLTEDGTVCLVRRAGAVELTRSWWGRVHLADVPEVHPWPRPTADVVATLNASRPAQSAPQSAPADRPAVHLEIPRTSAPRPRPGAAHGSASKTAPKAAAKRTQKGATDADAERRYAEMLATGELPSERQIKREMNVGQDRAKAIREHLAARMPGVVEFRRRQA